jgi:DNA-binding CsgD family transcriptional regulator
MANQISYDHPVWELSPQEFQVAYLSLTMTKKEIAVRLDRTESNIGTHLTNVFDKLGLSGFPDEEKRPLLREKFGSVLERIAAEVHEDFQGEYRRIRKEALDRKSEISQQSQSAEMPRSQPTMHETPPAPRPIPSIQPDIRRRGLPRAIWFIVGFLVVFGLCGFFAINFLRGILSQPPTNTPQANTQAVIVNTQTIPTATQSPIQTVEPAITATFTSLPPTDTSIPTVAPTAVPLPIIEHFNEPMKKVWEVTGDPILTTSNTGLGYDGVLTTLKEHFASIAVRNIASSDYIIHIRVYHEIGSVFLGFRVKDLNNMLGIECESWNCNWVVIEGGVKEIISEARDIYMETEFTLTVEGENFNGITSYGSGFDERHPFLVLPPKYEGKFLNGGIYIRFKDVEIDYIEILSIR